MAIEGSSVGSINALLDAGVWVDVPEAKSGWTPLLRAGLSFVVAGILMAQRPLRLG